MKAYLDGIPVTTPNESLSYPSLTLRRKDDTGDKAVSFTGDLLFAGPDRDYLYGKLVTDPNATQNRVELTLQNDCCTPAQEWKFWITHETLEWCEGSCELTASAIEKSIAADQLTCLKNTLIWDDWNTANPFTSRQHPRFSYCNELRPNWMHDCLIILGIATGTSILVLAPAIAGLILLFNQVNSIINWVNSTFSLSWPNISLGGNTNIDLADLVSYGNLLVAFLVGCGRKHPSPLVRDYADNVCGKCGLTFQSSIFNNPTSSYHNTCYVNAPINKGTLETDTTTFWIDENKPLLNGTKFFDKISSIVNGQYRIENNKVILERKDAFTPTTPWLDLTTYTPAIGSIKVCWKWTNKARYSYAVFEYTKDAVNWVGGEASGRWNDTVEWNNPYSSMQKDEFHPIIEFSPCRFRDDGIDRDVLTAYEWAPTIGPMIKKYKNAMLLNSHTCYQPMLLIWDPASGVANAKVDPTAAYFPSLAGLNEFYNYPFWFAEGYPDNLYTNFWYIENPRYAGFKGFDFEATMIFDCALLNAIDIDGTVQTSKGLGRVDSVELNFKTNQMTIKGTV